jgi:hypothetical protein
MNWMRLIEITLGAGVLSSLTDRIFAGDWIHKRFAGSSGRCPDALTECDYADRLQTPQVPPSLAQCLQYLQSLHALHGSAPTQVVNEAPEAILTSTIHMRAFGQIMCARWGIIDLLHFCRRARDFR